MRRWLADIRQKRLPRAMGAAFLGAAGLLLVGSFIVLVCELTAARVPEHRAALVRIVRAQTGLDLSFGELALRWGWHGPQAVFLQVALGEPGRAEVMLRAPELIVDFDPWRSVQSGRLQESRITLISPDIELPRREDKAAHPRIEPGGGADSAQILARWRGGRIDFEGGTLHFFAPGGGRESWAVSIRRASMVRERAQWHVQALVLLPERLGASAHVDLVLRGDLSQAASLGGSLRLEGERWVFAGWRHVLEGTAELARLMPCAGGGDITARADFAGGRLVQASGSVRAGGVEFADSRAADHVLLVDRVRGDWRLAREGSGWRAEVDSLQIGRSVSDAADAGHASLHWRGSRLRVQVSRLPLESLAAAVGWAAPQLPIAGADISGTARDLRLDWDGARAVGARLALQGRLEDVAVAPASHAFELAGLDAQVSGDERAWGVELAASAMRVARAARPDEPLGDVRVASHLNISRTEGGWRVATDALDIAHGGARLLLSGSLSAPRAERAPLLQGHGTLADMDLALLQQLFGDELQARFGAAASHVKSGHIADAQFALTRGGSLTGALALTHAVVADGSGLEAHEVDAHVDWNDAGISALIERGRAGPLELGPMQLAWRADGRSALQVQGRASGPLEKTLAWVHEHPQLNETVPEVRGLVARGEARFDFDLALPVEGARRPRARERLHARVAVSLEEATVLMGPGVPALQSVRGALGFEGGHLQRSLLTGRWLGGPVSLRLMERPERRAGAFSVKAQGLMDVRELAALGTVADPAQLDGQAEWSGDFVLDPQSAGHAAHWQARFDAALTGVASRLPEPLTKAAGVAAPLHVDVAGSSERAELHLALADRLHSVFEIVAAGEEAWRVARGSVRFGGTGPVGWAGESGVVLSGNLARLEASPYLAAWNRAGRELLLPRLTGGLFVTELLSGGRAYANANLQLSRSGGALDLQIEPLPGERPGT